MINANHRNHEANLVRPARYAGCTGVGLLLRRDLNSRANYDFGALTGNSGDSDAGVPVTFGDFNPTGGPIHDLGRSYDNLGLSFDHRRASRNQEILTVGEPRLWPKSGLGRKVQSSVP
jgi:hypothetical protein